jgi:hypothetical protein
MSDIICVLLLAFGSGPPDEGDHAYGWNGLPFLTRNASVIVTPFEASEIKESLPGHGKDKPSRATLAFVRVGETLKGKLEKNAGIVVLFPYKVSVEKAGLSRGILFLHGPLDKEEMGAWGISVDRSPCYVVVSETWGLISGLQEKRVAAAKDYIGASERLPWAERLLSNPDEFLQHSAFFELEEQAPRHAKQVVPILKNSLNSSNVRLTSKIVAINGLAASKSPEALEALAEYAAKSSNPAQHRRLSVFAVIELPGGPELLRKWEKGSDPVLQPAAKQALTKLDASLKDRDESELLAKLYDVKHQRHVMSALQTRQASAKAIEAVSLLASDNSADNSVRLQSIELLGRWNRQECAKSLETIVLNEKQPSLIRKAAVLAINKLSVDLRRTTLERLIKLDDAEVSPLIKGLAEKP